MAQKIIKLDDFRGHKSSIFTGRFQGQEVRRALNLDELDKSRDIEVIITIPRGTTSFNPSFYLGLLYPSFKTLGAEGFAAKYKFKIEALDKETEKVIQQNLEDGMRNAINALNNKTGLKPFLK